MEMYKCYRCNGIGKLIIPNKRLFVNRDVTMTCYICHGEGELDWIENARGRKNPLPIMDSSASVVNVHGHSIYRKPHGSI